MKNLDILLDQNLICKMNERTENNNDILHNSIQKYKFNFENLNRRAFLDDFKAKTYAKPNKKQKITVSLTKQEIDFLDKIVREKYTFARNLDQLIQACLKYYLQKSEGINHDWKLNGKSVTINHPRLHHNTKISCEILKKLKKIKKISGKSYNTILDESIEDLMLFSKNESKESFVKELHANTPSQTEKKCYFSYRFKKKKHFKFAIENVNTEPYIKDRETKNCKVYYYPKNTTEFISISLNRYLKKQYINLHS